MTDPLRLLFGRADVRDSCYSAEEVATWAHDVFEQFTSAGLLKAAAHATSVVCDACAGDHIEEVVCVESPPGTGLRAYIRCPLEGRVPVPLERLRRWEVNIRAVAQQCASALATSGEVEEVVPSRVWLLGKTSLGRLPYEIFFCRGLSWPDGAEVVGRAARLLASPQPVILVPGNLPDGTIWAGDVPVVLPLSALMSWEGERLSCDRAQLELAVGKKRKAKPPAPTPSFPTPEGTTWEEVHIVVADLRLYVDVRGKRKGLTFQEAGFEDKRRGGVPDRLWRLLKLLAVHHGTLPSAPARSRNNLKQDVSQLGKRLTGLLHIQGRPFKDASVTHRYEAVFRISSAEGLRFPTPDGLTWDRVTIEEIRPGTISVGADAAAPIGVFTRSEETDTRGSWEAAVELSVLKREYDLRSLGLADEDDHPNAAGEALLAVLRAGGKVQRGKTDKAMLTLCRYLSDLMQIDGSPFQFFAGQKIWSARFEAISSEPRTSR